MEYYSAIEKNYVFLRKMGRTGDNHVRQNKTDSERQIFFLSHVESRPYMI
jgi:hypothetical protein